MRDYLGKLRERGDDIGSYSLRLRNQRFVQEAGGDIDLFLCYLGFQDKRKNGRLHAHLFVQILENDGTVAVMLEKKHNSEATRVYMLHSQRFYSCRLRTFV